MKRFYSLFFSILLISFISLNAQDVFHRSIAITTADFEPAGFGGIIAGVDWDGDGLPEIYACNSNYIDTRPGELVPRIYKFEWNPVTSAWDSVWGATLPGQAQNTWIEFVAADLDKDGKPEIIWCPSNFPEPDVPDLVNPKPLRVIVFEVVGDGSDNLGVDDGFGGWMPNAATTIVDLDNANFRPISVNVLDIDSDGTDEIIFADQATSYHYGVLSVDDIPDAGGGTETWTLEANGLGDANMPATNMWDVAVIGTTFYLFGQNGVIYPVKYDNGTYTSLPGITSLTQYGSFKGSVTKDLDNDGTDEIILGSWFTGGKVAVLKQVADTLQAFEVADLSTIGATRLNGAATGDLDNDGKPDFVFGSRGDQAAPSVPNNSVYRVEFQGGDMTLPANWVSSIIDSFLVPEPDGIGGQLDVITIFNVDGDAADEVIYTQGFTRGVADDTVADVAILDIQFTPVKVEAVDIMPEEFSLEQNYPNPFNPSTTIRFGITNESVVNLKVYDILGKQVASLISGERMSAGTYDVSFDASNLASGTYIYKITAGNQEISKKMMLLK